MEAVVAHIEPVQSGTGDPSPTNVRPISGWTGVTISYSGEDTSHPGTLYVSWQSEAGVVYGGELDVTTGVLRVDRLKTTVAEQSWTYESAYRRFKATITNLKLGAVRQINVMADRFVTINDGRSESQVPNNAIYGAGSSSAVFVESSDYTDEAQFSNAYGACEIVYPLEIPVEYNIAPHQIDTLYGENNIWADTGDVNVTYRADTKLYIDNKVAEILNA